MTFKIEEMCNETINGAQGHKKLFSVVSAIFIPVMGHIIVYMI